LLAKATARSFQTTCAQALTSDWQRAEHRPVDGPGVRTGDSILWGFGLEAVAGRTRSHEGLPPGQRFM
jgi:hypothetical protein